MDKGAIITGLITACAALLAASGLGMWKKEVTGKTDQPQATLEDIQTQHMLYQLRELQRLANALIISPKFKDFKHEDKLTIQSFNYVISTILKEKEDNS